MSIGAPTRLCLRLGISSSAAISAGLLAYPAATRCLSDSDLYGVSHHTSFAPVSDSMARCEFGHFRSAQMRAASSSMALSARIRSEEHTSELQSRLHLVC